MGVSRPRMSAKFWTTMMSKIPGCAPIPPKYSDTELPLPYAIPISKVQYNQEQNNGTSEQLFDSTTQFPRIHSYPFSDLVRHRPDWVMASGVS